MTVLDDYESLDGGREEVEPPPVAFPGLVIPDHKLDEVTSAHVRGLLQQARKQTEAIRELRDKLMEAMCWEDTSEGGDFWGEIYRKLSLLRQASAARVAKLKDQLRKKLADKEDEEKEGG